MLNMFTPRVKTLFIVLQICLLADFQHSIVIIAANGILGKQIRFRNNLSMVSQKNLTFPRILWGCLSYPLFLMFINSFGYIWSGFQHFFIFLMKNGYCSSSSKKYAKMVLFGLKTHFKKYSLIIKYQLINKISDQDKIQKKPILS